MKLKYLIVLITMVSSCTLPKTLPKPIVNNEPKKIYNKVILTSEYGHKIEVEVDYILGSDGYLNNTEKIQYVITNLSEKNIKPIVAKYKIPTANNAIQEFYYNPAIEFEFSTSDNKVIRKEAKIIIPKYGETSEVNSIRIDLGLRKCSEVKIAKMVNGDEVEQQDEFKVLVNFHKAIKIQ